MLINCTVLVLLCVLLRVQSYPDYKPAFRIVGGQPVKITEVPFMAQYRPRSESHYCGASIIHHRFLVSAAHCHYDMKALNLTLYITVGSDKAKAGGEEYEIAHTYPHPNYINNKDYDVAVIQLVKPLIFSDRVKSIPLAKKNFIVPEGAMFDTLGFGRTSFNGKTSNQLLKVSVPYVNVEQCKRVYTHVTERMVCAGVEGKDSCGGDSGGPLTYRGILVGVVSHGKGCGEKNYPGIYAFIPTLRDFIDSVVAKNI